MLHAYSVERDVQNNPSSIASIPYNTGVISKQAASSFEKIRSDDWLLRVSCI